MKEDRLSSFGTFRPREGEIFKFIFLCVKCKSNTILFLFFKLRLIQKLTGSGLRSRYTEVISPKSWESIVLNVIHR